jgi:hypothetical protein
MSRARAPAVVPPGTGHRSDEGTCCKFRVAALLSQCPAEPRTLIYVRHIWRLRSRTHFIYCVFINGWTTSVLICRLRWSFVWTLSLRRANLGFVATSTVVTQLRARYWNTVKIQSDPKVNIRLRMSASKFEVRLLGAEFMKLLISVHLGHNLFNVALHIIWNRISCQVCAVVHLVFGHSAHVNSVDQAN